MSLSLTQVNFSYAANCSEPVLTDFSYSFKPGRFYGIFGANGSGKSTLLKLLAGDLTGDKPVLLEGRVLQSLKNAFIAEKLAYAAQEEELVLPFKVRDCIKLGRYIRRDENAPIIDRLLETFQIAHLAEKNFAELSGGERQKVKLLRIFAQDTEYILLDEPASSLDLPRQLELYENLQRIAHNENKCIIMVCHDLYTAPSFIDEMLLLKKGKLLYGGSPDTPEAGRAVSCAFDRQLEIRRNNCNNVEISW